jgi:signal transduction histidine kinase
MRQGGAVERGVLIGAAGLRWAAWVWLAVVALANLHRVHHSWLAVTAVAVTGAVTVTTSAVLKDRNQRAALRPGIVALEVMTAVGVILADGWVQQGRLTGQTLAGSWLIPSILVAAVAGGVVWGIATAALLAAARAVAVALSGWEPHQGGRAALAVVSTSVEWIAFGAVAGVVIYLLRTTRQQLAEAEIREQIAKDLHDGVLQTLTMIERRSPSPEIARLARDQERDLRSYLFGDHRHQGTLGAALRTCSARFERNWPDSTVTVTLTEDAAGLQGALVEAISGAVTEALTNAAKHGAATHILVFADVDDTTGSPLVTVKDDGRGFDPSATTLGTGMTGSIQDRIERLGGHVEFVSAPGQGAEVRIYLP